MLYTENFLAKSTLGIRYQAFLLKYAGTSVSNTAAIYLKENLECTYTIFSQKKSLFLQIFVIYLLRLSIYKLLVNAKYAQ